MVLAVDPRHMVDDTFSKASSSHSAIWHHRGLVRLFWILTFMIAFA